MLADSSLRAGDMNNRTLGPRDLGFGRLFDAVRDGVVATNVDSGLIELWNAAAVRIFGWEVDEAIGETLEILVPERLRAMHRAGIRRYRETGHGPLIDSNEPVELPAIRKDGTEIFVELSLSQINDPSTETRFVVALIRDITERKRMQQELEKRYEVEKALSERLLELDGLKNDFVAMVAHDLKNPVTLVAGFAQLLATELGDTRDDRLRELVAGITEAAETQASLIDSILQMARVESGTLHYELVPFDITGLVRSTARQAAASFGEDRFHIETDEPPPVVFADPDRCRQVLTNLITNAIKFSDPKTPIELRAVRSSGEVRVSVRDSGQGISPEDLDSIFDKFVRVTSDDPLPGTGLGLYIAKRIVEDQGGKIEVSSSLGEGSEFTISLPAAIPSE
jgi:PAS domain S-box-containing protein